MLAKNLEQLTCSVCLLLLMAYDIATLPSPCDSPWLEFTILRHSLHRVMLMYNITMLPLFIFEMNENIYALCILHMNMITEANCVRAG